MTTPGAREFVAAFQRADGGPPPTPIISCEFDHGRGLEAVHNNGSHGRLIGSFTAPRLLWRSDTTSQGKASGKLPLLEDYQSTW